MKYLILIISWLLLIEPFYAQNNPSTIQLFSPDKLNSFTPADNNNDFYKGSDNTSIAEWALSRNPKWYEESHIPDPNKATRYVTYAVLGNGIWFGPYNSTEEQQTAFRQLVKLMNKIRENGEEDARFIRVTAVTVGAGQNFGDHITEVIGNGATFSIKEMAQKEALMEQQRILEEIAKLDPSKLNLPDENQTEKMDQMATQVANGILSEESKGLLAKLQEEFGPNDTGGDGNGMKGLFPVTKAFSQWFARLMEVAINLLDQYLCGGQCKQVLQKALMLAYAINPDLMDRIVSGLAEIQDGFFSDDIDKNLNKITKSVDIVLKLYDDVMKFKKIYNSANFQELLKNADVNLMLDGLGKLGVPTNKFKEACNYLPCDGFLKSKYDEYMSGIINWARNKAIDVGVEHMKKSMPNNPLGIDFGAVKGLLNNGNMEDFSKAQAKAMACHKLGPYGSDCEKLVGGDHKGAIKSAVARSISEGTGLKKEEIEGIANGLKEGNADKIFKNAANMAPNIIQQKFGVSKDSIHKWVTDPQRFKQQIEKSVQNLVKKSTDDEQVKRMLRAQYKLIQVNGRDSLLFKNTLDSVGMQFGLELKKILDTPFEKSMKKMIVDSSKNLGITDSSAIELLKKGYYNKAIEAQLGSLKNTTVWPPKVRRVEKRTDKETYEHIVTSFKTHFESAEFFNALCGIYEKKYVPLPVK